jgi:hypothetical protein
MMSNSNIKSTPPQSSPALRAREEARSKIKIDPSLTSFAAKSRWDDDLG